GSIDRRSLLRPERPCIHASAEVARSIPALASAPCACPSMEVRTAIDRSPVIARWKSAHRSMQDRPSIGRARRSIERSLHLHGWKSARRLATRALASIQVRGSLDRSPRFAERSGLSRTLSYRFFARSVSSTAFPTETSTRGMGLRGGASPNTSETRKEVHHEEHTEEQPHPADGRRSASDRRLHPRCVVDRQSGDRLRNGHDEGHRSDSAITHRFEEDRGNRQGSLAVRGPGGSSPRDQDEALRRGPEGESPRLLRR